jgi:pre-mRNA-processing factor 39
VPISRPGIRLQFALFEEMCGRVDVAREIHAAVLTALPDSVETIISWAHLQRRQVGFAAAIDLLKGQIDATTTDIFTKAALVTEWALLLWKVKGAVDEARMVFLKNVQWYADSRHFWQKWLEFEIEQPTSVEQEVHHGDLIRNVFVELRTKSRLSSAAVQELGQMYLAYLQQRGGKDAMKEFLTVDSQLFGYVVQSLGVR